MPLIRIIITGEFHDGRTMKQCSLVRFNLLGIPEIVPAKLELCAIRGSHPPVVEINNITVRTVVNDQWNNATFTIRKLLRELQYISDGCSAKTVETLVIVTNYTDVLSVSGEKKYQLLLDKVRILIFINHEVCNLGTQFIQYFFIFPKKMIGFNLNRRKVHQISFSENVAILFKHSPKSCN